MADDFRAIRERLQNSVNWMMEGRNTGLCPGVADFQALIRLIDAGAQPVAWAVFAPNGNVRLWSTDCEAVRKFAAEHGLPLTPLYTAAGVSRPAAPLVSEPAAQQPTQRELDMAMLIKRLARRLEPPDSLRTQATEYLKQHGLIGSPLRAEPAVQVEPSKTEIWNRNYAKRLSNIEQREAVKMRAEVQVDAPLPPMPSPACVHGGGVNLSHRFTADQMRDYVLADRRQRAAEQPDTQQPDSVYQTSASGVCTVQTALPAGWRMSVQEDEDRSWLRIVSPEGGEMAFSAQRGSNMAQLMQDFSIALIGSRA